MGCFSFLCKESGKPALSTSFDGSPCYMFLLKDGVVLEEMHGNYDSYGGVFSNGLTENSDLRQSFEWEMDWGDVCSLMHSDKSDCGIAIVLSEFYKGNPPDEKSPRDPNQGWGDGCFLSKSPNKFKRVENPYHVVYHSLKSQSDDDDEIEII